MRKYTVFLIAVAMVLCQAVVVEARGKKEAAKSPAPTSTATTPAATPAPTARYLQTDTQIQSIIVVTGEQVNQMEKWGCCFMSCLGVAQTAAKKNLTSSQINEIFASLSAAQKIGPYMYVSDVALVINRGLSALNSGLTAVVTKTTVKYESTICDSTIVQGTTTTGYIHWVEGDSRGETVYDPFSASSFTEITKVHYIRISGYQN